MADERIEIEIVLDDGTVKKGFATIEKSAKQAADSTEKSFTKSLVGLKGAFAAAAGAAAAVFGGRAAIRAAAQQEKAINELNTSLKLAGTFSEDTSKSLQEFASSLQEVSTIGDETTLSLLAQAQNFTTSAEEAQKLTEAAVELSAATGISLDSAVKNLGKTFGGLTGELGESVPALRSLSKEALQSGAALDFVLDRFGGAAQAQLQTFSGAVQQSENAFGDLLEQIGNLIVKNPVVIKLINDFSEVLIKTTKSIAGFISGGGLDTITNAALALGIALSKFVIVPLEAVGKTAQLAFSGLQLLIQGAINQTVQGAVKLLNALPLVEAPQALKDFAAATQGTLDQIVADNQAINDSLPEFDISTDVENYILDLQKTLTATQMFNEEFKQQSGETLEASAKAFKITSAQINEAFNKSLTKGISAGIQALAKGEAGFDAFGKTILKSFGGFLIQLGEAAILVGLGAEAVQKAIASLSGGAAIAAGIALIAAGSAFQALAGGPDSAGPTAANGGALVGTEPEFDTGVDAVGEDDLAETQGQIAINVDGTVLDPRSVGLQIAEVLKEVNDSNDLVTVNV